MHDLQSDRLELLHCHVVRIAMSCTASCYAQHHVMRNVPATDAFRPEHCPLLIIDYWLYSNEVH